ncbi:hypothetical protein, partial [Vagococcus sp.]|uniref:hypothetical protein n=1 Tax=Vagococcus sp. TaxID=1933889 RepID=UPI000EE8E494
SYSLLLILSSATVPVITYANELETYNEVQVENFEDEELPEVLDENLIPLSLLIYSLYGLFRKNSSV